MRPLALLLACSMGCTIAEPGASTSARRQTCGEDAAAGADAAAPTDAAPRAEDAPSGEHPVDTLSRCPIRGATRPPVSLLASVEGALTASLSDGADGWYLAGSFTEVAGVPVQGLAHVLATGEVDERLRHGVDVDPWRSWSTNVNAMVRIGTTLYIAGGFVSVAGAERRYFAAFDVMTGELLPWNPLPSPVSIEEREHRLFCDFSNNHDLGCRSLTTDGETIFGAALCGVVAFDRVSGSLPPGFIKPRFDGVEDGVIATVAAIDDALCVDGRFTRVATSSADSPTYVPRNGAAWFDPRNGKLLP